MASKIIPILIIILGTIPYIFDNFDANALERKLMSNFQKIKITFSLTIIISLLFTVLFTVILGLGAKEVVLKEDTLKENINIENGRVKDILKENILLEDVLKEDIILEDVLKENILLEDVLNEDTKLEDILKEDNLHDIIYMFIFAFVVFFSLLLIVDIIFHCRNKKFKFIIKQSPFDNWEIVKVTRGKNLLLKKVDDSEGEFYQIIKNHTNTKIKFMNLDAYEEYKKEVKKRK